MVRADFSVFSSALDTFVGVLVEVGKILPEFFVGSVDDVSILNGGELGCEITDGRCMEFVLMRL